MSIKRILVLGGTGAMGSYLIPYLLEAGHHVTAVSLDDRKSDTENLEYIKSNVKEGNNLDLLLEGKYNAIIDFMTYGTKQFEMLYEKLLKATDHYFFLSSCRVYADNPPISERSPRLLDVCTDAEFLKTDDYALYKAREEDILINSKYDNWTIVRPATTFSTGRFQLVTLEAESVIYRMQAGKTIVLPEPAMSRQATLGWGGDVAKMIARLVFNPKAYREDYIVATAEHHSWEEIAQIYNSICPFKYITVSIEDYLNIIAPNQMWARYQLMYARMFQRITDNSKVLEHTGLKQSEFKTLEDGLRFEYEKSKNMDWEKFAGHPRNVNMDEYLKNHGF